MKKEKLVSFDIWDTILRRRCHPDEVKLYTSRYVLHRYYRYIKPEFQDIFALLSARQNCEADIGRSLQQEGFDDEYSWDQVFLGWLHVIFEPETTPAIDYKLLVNELVEIEMNQEKYVTYLDDAIVNYLEKIQCDKRIFISDFYAGKSNIVELLSSVNFPVKYIDGYVSSEVGLNKRSGKLFKHIHQKINVNASEHIHVGDNIHSDVRIPLSLGIEGRHYVNQMEEEKRQALTRLFDERRPNSSVLINYLQQQLINDGTITPSKDSERLFQLGKNCSLLFITFILSIIEDCEKKGFSEVFYFTREGEFFKKIHDQISKFNPLGWNISDAKILEVSRVATFGPSLTSMDIEQLMRLWNQYSTQSMKAFFSSLGLELGNYVSFLRKYDIGIEEEIQYPWLDARVKQLLSDSEFNHSVMRSIDEKRSLLKQYFLEKGISDEITSFAIVDIGWRGTIQDNLAYIFNSTDIQGYYFGMFDFINQQPQNTSKCTFISKEEMKLFQFVSPIEMLCNSISGSVSSYYLDKENKIRANKIDDPQENAVNEKYVNHFQKGVLESVEYWCDVIRCHAITSEELKPTCINLLKSLLNNPPYVLTKAFFELAHNETFGLGKFVEKGASFPIKLSILALFSRSNRRNFKKAIDDTSWPQGFLTYHKLSFLNKHYNSWLESKINIKKPNLDTNEKVIIISKEEYDALIRMIDERYNAILEMDQMIKERDHTIQQLKIENDHFRILLEKEKEGI